MLTLLLCNTQIWRQICNISVALKFQENHPNGLLGVGDNNEIQDRETPQARVSRPGHRALGTVGPASLAQPRAVPFTAGCLAASLAPAAALPPQLGQPNSVSSIAWCPLRGPNRPRLGSPELDELILTNAH